MRLLVTGLWVLGAAMWLSWFLIVLRLLVSLAMGEAWDNNPLVTVALVGIWPVHGLLSPWVVESWFPISALLGCAMTAVGWRIYWREQDFRLTRPPFVVALSIAVPLLAPFIMWADARRRHLAKEDELEHNVQEALERIEDNADQA